MIKKGPASDWIRDFERVSGIALPTRKINKITGAVLREDILFDRVAAACFDRPALGPALERRLPLWLSWASGQEQCWALAGYVYYCRGRYRRAERALARAIQLEPENLDNWLDLGMTLRHLGEPLGLDILLDHSLFIMSYRKLNPGGLNRKILRDLRSNIRSSGREYRLSFRQWIS